jgi:ribosomal protein L11 methyltransferase
VAIRHLKKGGVIITSGILDVKEAEVEAALRAAGFTILETTRMGEWVSITAVK